MTRLPDPGLVRIAVACSVVWLGCGGGGPRTSPISADEATEHCQPRCVRDAMCDPGEDFASCMASCVETAAGWADVEAIEILMACAAAVPCAEDPSSCNDDVQPQEVHERWEARCRETLTCLTGQELEDYCETTPDDPMGVDDGLVRFIAADIVEEMIACFDDPACFGAIGCIVEIYQRYGIN